MLDDPRRQHGDDPRPFDLGFYLDPRSPRLEEELAVLGKFGIGTVGFSGTNFLGGTNYPTPWTDRPDRETDPDTERIFDDVTALLDAWDVDVAALHSPFSLTCPTGDLGPNVEDNVAVLELADRLGARSTVWHFNSPRSSDGTVVGLESALAEASMSMGEYDAYRRDVIRATCREARRRNLEVNLENVPRYHAHDPERIVSLIEELSIPNLGLLLDTGHAWATDKDPATAIRRAGPHLNDLHLQDNLGSLGLPLDETMNEADYAARDMHLLPGLGTIDWIDTIRALRGVGFEEPLLFEAELPAARATIANKHREVETAIALWRALERAARYTEVVDGE